MENLGIFYDHLVYFTAIGNIFWPFGIYSGNLVYFSLFWYFGPRKIWQPWFRIVAILRRRNLSVHNNRTAEWPLLNIKWICFKSIQLMSFRLYAAKTSDLCGSRSQYIWSGNIWLGVVLDSIRFVSSLSSGWRKGARNKAYPFLHTFSTVSGGP
jgi:hypothetical protein